MKKLLIATLFTLPVQAATIIYDDGSQVEVPDSWAWSIKMQVKAPPKHCPPAHCPPMECPPSNCPTSKCDFDPYIKGCPLACDGETPGDRCRRQREELQ